MIKEHIKERPRLFDIVKRASRILPGRKDDQYRFFNQFSKSLGRPLSFIQIGASDGLRWDPIREFVIRDRWQGIFVEPLPSMFQALKNNYRYIDKGRLVFVNAAISSAERANMSFWTFNEAFMVNLSLEQRIIYSQKSSFNKEHVERWISLNDLPNTVLQEVIVPCMTLNDLLASYWNWGAIDLIVIDAEGYESVIIPTIDFANVRPKALFFESHNLGTKKHEIYELLRNNSYSVSEIGGDSVALIID